MDRKEKQAFVGELRERLMKAEGTFVVDYQGLDVEALNTLRRELRKAQVEFQVVKNRLLKLASEGTETQVLGEQMRGPSAVALAYGDVVAPAKALVAFAKDFKKFGIKGGQISGRAVGPDDIKKLSELPGREVLLAQVLAAMQGVPASLVRVLNGTIAQLLYALNAIIEQKQAQA